MGCLLPVTDPNTVTLTTTDATITVSRYGGQVLHYGVAKQSAVLWCNPPELLAQARQAGRAQRGGVPVCWPWFGAPVGAAKAAKGPSHGLARLRPWQVVHQQQTAASASVVLQHATHGDAPAFPYSTTATLEVLLTDRLTLTLTTHNRSSTPVAVSAGLHTYLRVGDGRRVTLHGLAGSPRTDLVTNQPLPALSGETVVEGETDWLCHQVSPTLRLTDPVLGRELSVGLIGTRSAVIWNPGALKAATLDIPADDWTRLVCLEAAVLPAVEIPAGETHVMGTWIHTKKL